MKLFMITGLGSAESLAAGKQGAFYYTLQEFHQYWDRIDILAPRTSNTREKTEVFFGNVYVHSSGWPLILHPIYFLKKGFELWKQERFGLMTVQEFPPFYNGAGAFILHWLTGVPYVLEIMHIPGLPRASGPKERIYKWLAKLFIALDTMPARAVRVINQNQSRQFLVAAGVAEGKIHYIPAFYIDLNIFYPMPITKKYDLVFAGRLEKNKGIINLVKAIKILKKYKPDISLLIIGSGPLHSELKTLIKREGLERNIIFSGWLETNQGVAEAYNSARIFVSPSFNEGGPRVALEAMACGVPVVTTPVGIMLDVIRHGENGLFCDWKPRLMAEELSKLLMDTESQNKFKEAGLALVKQFEKKSAVKNYADKLRSLI